MRRAEARLFHATATLTQARAEGRRIRSMLRIWPRVNSGMPTRDKRIPWTQKLLVVTLAVAVVGSTLAITRQSAYAFFDPLIDVKQIIDRYAVERPEEDAMQRAAIEAMLEELDDPYATYVPAEQNEEFSQELTGEYVGIGAEVTVRDDYLHIVTPLDGSPALEAGLMAGDRVVEVDGTSTEGMAVEEAVALIKGEPGTTVELLIERDGETLTVEIERERITTPAVRGLHRREGDQSWQYVIDPQRDVAYVRLNQFTPTSPEALLEAIESAEDEVTTNGGDDRLGGLILDLRFNPGGVLSSAVEMADLFLGDGVIVSTRGRPEVHPEEVYRAEDDGAADRAYPVAVLINGQSASASEVLAGALVENDRAIAVGTRTFGKGSVQAVRSLSGSASGAQLKLTEQRYYLPSGRSIQRLEDSAEWGVDPTSGFFVDMTTEETREMLTARRQEEIIGRDNGADVDWSDPQEILDALKDPQLAAAVEAMKKRLAEGEWVPVAEEAPEIDPSMVAELREARKARERILRQLERTERRISSLESGVEDEDAITRTEIDLIPDDATLEGGTLEILGPAGDEIARLRITGANLERWLIDAGVEPIEPAEGDGSSSDPAAEDGEQES